MREPLTQIHGCLRASAAETRLAGLTVSMLLMRLLASGVTVSHSGDGYYIFIQHSSFTYTKRCAPISRHRKTKTNINDRLHVLSKKNKNHHSL